MVRPQKVTSNWDTGTVENATRETSTCTQLIFDHTAQCFCKSLPKVFQYQHCSVNVSNLVDFLQIVGLLYRNIFFMASGGEI